MDVAALILSLCAFLMSAGSLVLLLAKRFSTHKIEFVNAPQQGDTQVIWEQNPFGGMYDDAPLTPRPQQPQKPMTVAEEERLARLDREERALEAQAAALNIDTDW